MAENPFETQDYLGTARERVTEQFKDKTIFDRYLQLLISGKVSIQQVYKDLMQLRSLDTAKGKQLDLIGEIVGQDRELIAADLYDFFGMQAALNAFSMGDLADPSLGGIFYTFGTDLGGNIQLDDETYRLFIRAKIYKNNTSSTPEDFIKAVSLIFGVDQVSIIAEGYGSVSVLLGKQLSSFERVLLNYVSSSRGYPSRLVPKTVGVNINFGEFEPNNYFGFSDSPGAKGFGDIVVNKFDGSHTYDGSLKYSYSSNSSVEGGVFASLFGV